MSWRFVQRLCYFNNHRVIDRARNIVNIVAERAVSGYDDSLEDGLAAHHSQRDRLLVKPFLEPMSTDLAAADKDVPRSD